MRSDSYSAIQACASANLPWCIQHRWLAVCASYEMVTFEHAYREINFTVYNLAKRGCSLQQGESISNIGRPNFINNIEMPAVAYFRFQ